MFFKLLAASVSNCSHLYLHKLNQETIYISIVIYPGAHAQLGGPQGRLFQVLPSDRQDTKDSNFFFNSSVIDDVAFMDSYFRTINTAVWFLDVLSVSWRYKIQVLLIYKSSTCENFVHHCCNLVIHV